MKHDVTIKFSIDPTTRSTTDTANSALQIVHSILSSIDAPDEIEIECEGIKRTIKKTPSNRPPPL
jgi:hypothetical protein